ncbi:MAG: cation diffusion facilitator family transporter [Chloroflexota bacterium]|nr:cation diffusion facilitator family transporter [Chloroflexota bacterium]
MHHHHHHHAENEKHAHTHGAVDPTIATTSRGIWAIKWSFVGLGITAVLQAAVFALSGSVALLADTIHNIGDAMTAVPLWIAFLFARRVATRRFGYGFGRVEDLAGAVIVLVILSSAIVAAYQSVDRLLNPQDVELVWAVAAAGAIGFIGNEAVALFRIRVGREINSAALVADGYHARTDGLASLAVVAGAIAIWAGFPIADPIVGLGISALIAKIVYDSAKTVFGRMLDGVDPEVLDNLEHEALHVQGVRDVTSSRARWIGHRLHAEVHLTASKDLSLKEAHELAKRVSHELAHAIPFLGEALIHVEPADHSDAGNNPTSAHKHDGPPLHSH